MININGTDVKIAGSDNEILYELIVLKITIMQDPGLMAIDQEAMEQAIEIYQNQDYRFPEVRRFKVHSQDKTEEFKKSRTDGEKNDMYLCKYNISKECKGAYKDCVDCVLEDIKAEIKKYHVDSDWTEDYGEGFDDGIEYSLDVIDKVQGRK